MIPRREDWFYTLTLRDGSQVILDEPTGRALRDSLCADPPPPLGWRSIVDAFGQETTIHTSDIMRLIRTAEPLARRENAWREEMQLDGPEDEPWRR